MTTGTAERDDLDRVLHALADPTRRAVVQRLGVGPASTSELARPFDMALTSFAQHMQVLELAGLVHSLKVGRVRTYRLDPAPLQPLSDWLAQQKEMWTARLDRLDAFLIAGGADSAPTTNTTATTAHTTPNTTPNTSPHTPHHQETP